MNDMTCFHFSYHSYYKVSAFFKMTDTVRESHERFLLPWGKLWGREQRDSQRDTEQRERDGW